MYHHHDGCHTIVIHQHAENAQSDMGRNDDDTGRRDRQDCQEDVPQDRSRPTTSAHASLMHDGRRPASWSRPCKSQVMSERENDVGSPHLAAVSYHDERDVDKHRQNMVLGNDVWTNHNQKDWRQSDNAMLSNPNEASLANDDDDIRAPSTPPTVAASDCASPSSPPFAYPFVSKPDGDCDQLPRLEKSNVSTDFDLGESSSSVQSLPGRRKPHACDSGERPSDLSLGQRLRSSTVVGPAKYPTKPLARSIAANEKSPAYGGRRRLHSLLASVPTASRCSPMISDDDDEHSIGSDNADDCVPVTGRLVDLPDNDSHSSNHSDDDGEDEEGGEGGGVLIVEESTEEEYAESMREFSRENHHRLMLGSSPARQRDPPSSSRPARVGARRTEEEEEEPPTEEEIVACGASSSVFEIDSAMFAPPPGTATANPTASNGIASLDFERLLQEADADFVLPDAGAEAGGEGESKEDSGADLSEDSGTRRWNTRRNPFAPRSLAPPPPPPRRNNPVRATRIRSDEYLVEMEVWSSSSDATANDGSRVDAAAARDAMDAMANVDLLHLWFDPVPAVFDASVRDGSGHGVVVGGGGGGTTAPPPPPRRSSDDDDDAGLPLRRHDGQWVEISTPPLAVPPDARAYGCLRAVRAGFRSLVGFPSRIRSVIFVERRGGRMGMTIGPYPDGNLCEEGTVAHHAFRVQTVARGGDAEDLGGGGGDGGGGRVVVISDEVRLSRGGDEGFFDGATTTTRGCCCCCFARTPSALRLLLKPLEWAFRWGRPDLASYMQQTVSSMEKLRDLVERGEAAAYAGGEMAMDGIGDWEGGDVDEAMGAPLLGGTR